MSKDRPQRKGYSLGSVFDYSGATISDRAVTTTLQPAHLRRIIVSTHDITSAARLVLRDTGGSGDIVWMANVAGGAGVSFAVVDEPNVFCPNGLHLSGVGAITGGAAARIDVVIVVEPEGA